MWWEATGTGARKGRDEITFGCDRPRLGGCLCGPMTLAGSCREG